MKIMKIIDTTLLKKLQEVELQLQKIRKNDPLYQKEQTGMERIRTFQRAPLTSESFRNVEFHPTYHSLKNR